MDIEKRISERMKCIAGMVTPGKRVADIGCDHAYTSIYLIEKKLAEAVIAMDVAEGPLSSAKSNIIAFHLEDKIETRLSDGMSALSPGETQLSIIAGMGGLLIIDILKRGEEIWKEGYEFVLSPQSELPEVRRFLRENCLQIVDEQMMLEDGKYYNIIKAVYCSDNDVSDAGDESKGNALSDATAETGFDTLNILSENIKDNYGEKLIEKKSPVLKQYLVEKLEKLNGIYCRLSKESGDRVVDRMAEVSLECSEIETVLEMLSWGRNSCPKGEGV